MRLPTGGNTAVSTLLGFLLSSHVRAYDHSDGISPYGSGYAPDVIIDNVGDKTSRTWKGRFDRDLIEPDNSTVTIEQTSKPDRRDAKDFYLRVMPLGASITQGLKSTDGNGYRRWLRAQLRYHGWKVNMVGSKQDGTMADSVS